MAKVVLVDDELTMVQMIGDLLRKEGHEVIPFSNLESALDGIAEHSPDLVITDLYLDKSGAKGLDVLRKARSLSPPPVVIVVTGFGTLDTAIEAMRSGAFDYLEKPFKVEDFRFTIRRALSFGEAVSETTFLRRELKKKYQFTRIIGTAEKMQAVFRMLERVADTESTILILGESGTGKELVAKALHQNSRRQHAPFIPINCSALPEALLESELFGHCRGAFTGAIADKKGLFQEADGGTIFLDEVGAMPPLLQSRLLRVLQEREIRRVGENTPIRVNVRVVAATNEPLENRIRDGGFREDLYYRLNVIPLHLPSLRERREDIPLLVAHFLRSKPLGRTGKPRRVSRQVMDVLNTYDWPGNVRELENAVERSATLCEGNVIRLRDLPPAILKAAGKDPAALDDSAEAELPTATESGPVGAPGADIAEAPRGGGVLPETVDDVKPLRIFSREQETAYMNRVIELAGGDKEQAAILLGVSLATLYRKLTEDEKAQ
ncbi:MAG: sigma-54 dependent transcriptional regulator [Verrucomicrobia bacterium]|jgi:DNA-binding NtrC family response regulator|nr:sigma-54 dependent transcriptional regulator [Verrucomicrobiota bacterium]